MHLLHIAILATVFHLGAAKVLARFIRDSDGSDWSYEGENGPAHWQGMCQTGTRQSPVDIGGPQKKLNGKKLTLTGVYDKRAEWVATWDGHVFAATLKKSSHVGVMEGGSLKGVYLFKALHIHFGSEHTINGQRFAAEMHLVHYNAMYSPEEAAGQPDGFAVLGVLIEEDDDAEPSPMLKFLEELTDEPSEGKTFKATLRHVLPAQLAPWIRYDGSLTTPSCTENVQWTVLSQRVAIKPGVVKKWKVLHGNSYRPTMPLNNRTIYIQSISSNLEDVTVAENGIGTMTYSWPCLIPILLIRITLYILY